MLWKYLMNSLIFFFLSLCDVSVTSASDFCLHCDVTAAHSSLTAVSFLLELRVRVITDIVSIRLLILSWVLRESFCIIRFLIWSDFFWTDLLMSVQLLIAIFTDFTFVSAFCSDLTAALYLTDLSLRIFCCDRIMHTHLFL